MGDSSAAWRVQLHAGMDPQELRQRSQRFALDITRFCDTLPKDARTQELAGQLHDAATSAAMNYRATCRAWSNAEFVAKLCVTVEEADEAQGGRQILVESGKASGGEVQRLLGEATELVKIFSATKRTSMANRRRTAKKRRNRETDD